MPAIRPLWPRCCGGWETFLYTLKAGPAGRPPQAAVLGRQTVISCSDENAMRQDSSLPRIRQMEMLLRFAARHVPGGAEPEA